MTLTDFLLARIAEDEADADEFWERDYPGDPEPGTWWKWVRDECEAKRRIVALFPDVAADGDGWNEAGLQVLELLALPYADHPDYREEWKP